MLRNNQRKTNLFKNLIKIKYLNLQEKNFTNKIIPNPIIKTFSIMNNKNVSNYVNILNFPFFSKLEKFDIFNYHSNSKWINTTSKNFTNLNIKNNWNSNITNIQKFNFSSNFSDNNTWRSNFDFTQINKKLNPEILFQILDKCDLDPKQEGKHLRLKTCPLCDKPHNYDKTNMYSCAINTENLLFKCFRCGSQGHVIRILKFLRKKFNYELINDILDFGNLSSTENEDSGKRMKGNIYNKENENNKIHDNQYNNKRNSLNSQSDFSDLEFYKVNKSKQSINKISNNSKNINNNNNNLNALSDNEFISDSEFNREKDSELNNTTPVFSPLLKNTISNKVSLNNTKNPFSTNSTFSNKGYINENTSNSNQNKKENNFDKFNTKINFNNQNNSCTLNAPLNPKLKHKNNNEITSDNNKPKFTISPITSISGADLNSAIKNSSFKISISNINLINEMYKRINLLEDEKLLIVKDYLINDRKINEDVLRFYNIGASFEKFKNNDFDYITLPTVSFPMFYPTDKASYLAVDKSNLKDEVYKKFNCDKFFLSRTKVRAIGKEFKHFMKIEPPGAVIWYF